MATTPALHASPLDALPPQANLSPLQVARFLDVSLDVIYRQVAEGNMPGVRVGRLIRIPRRAFLVWYEKNSLPNPPFPC